MVGKWNGFYTYDSQRLREFIGVEKTNFTIVVKSLENNHFTGTVEDDLLTKGTPGIGEIEGVMSIEKINFVKLMPIKAVLSFKNGMNTYPKKHKPIYYEGTFTSDKKSIEGTWKMKLGFSIFGYFVSLLSHTGTWQMHFAE